MNGKTLFALALVTLSLAAGVTPGRAFAQVEDPVGEAAEPPASQRLVLAGVDVAAALPVGDLAEVSALGFGALARFELGLTDRVRLTGRAGYIRHGEKLSGNLSEIPVLAGAKLDLTGSLYGAAEIGLFAIRFSGGPTPGRTNNLGMTLGVGYRLAALDFRLGVHVLDLAELGKTTEGVLSVGYNFWSTTL